MTMKRVDFIGELPKLILPPYEASEVYEEEIVGEFENEIEQRFFSHFVSLINPQASILDLACGDGRHTLRLAQNVSQVVAFDLSANNLRLAKEKCSKIPSITYGRGSYFELSFTSDLFDGIWFSQAFEYVPPDKREELLNSLNSILKTSGILYMSVETWVDSNFLTSLINLFSDFKLFCYWKFVKGKPLLWGEFLYYLSSSNIRDRCAGWHYHVHSDEWTLRKLLKRTGFMIIDINIQDGYFYVLCKKSIR